MNPFRLAKLSMLMIYRSMAKALLSTLSLTIGIACLMILMSLYEGTEVAMNNELEKMGKNLLSVGSERLASNALRGKSTRYLSLTLDDAYAIEKSVADVNYVAPIIMNVFSLRYQQKSMRQTVTGTTVDYQFTNNQVLVAGRFLQQDDLNKMRRVVIIGSEIVQKLFSNEQAIGETLLINNAPYEIIGILQEKGTDITGSAQDDKVIIPISTAQKRLINSRYVDRIFIQASSRELISQIITETRFLLREKHQIVEREPDDFTIRDQATLLNNLDESNSLLEQFLAGVVVLTLLLAGFGLMAVSVMNISSRTFEIGLRMAIGAKPLQIMLQFFFESYLISFVGTLSGIVLGVIGSLVLDQYFEPELVILWVSINYSFIVTLCMSLLFCAYPAFKAARLNPVQALKPL